MTFYGTPATGAGWIVPRKYVEKVGDEGFKKAPVGAGPYRFVSFTPGVELVLEAYEQYWRKTPSVKRLVFKVVPDEATRLAMLKRGEADVVYPIRGELAEEVQRTPGLTLKPTPIRGHRTGSSSPTSGTRSRRGPTAACAWPPTTPSTARPQPGRDAGVLEDHREHHPAAASTSTGSPRPIAYDPARPSSSSPRPATRTASTPATSAATPSYRRVARGDRSTTCRPSASGRRLRPLERAAFFKAYQEKKLKNLVYGLSGVFGNAATRIEAFVVAGGAYVYGSYPDIDGLFREQAAELDRKKREAILHRIQQLMHDKAMFAPSGSSPSSTASARAWRSRGSGSSPATPLRALRGPEAQGEVSASRSAARMTCVLVGLEVLAARRRGARRPSGRRRES